MVHHRLAISFATVSLVLGCKSPNASEANPISSGFFGISTSAGRDMCLVPDPVANRNPRLNLKSGDSVLLFAESKAMVSYVTRLSSDQHRDVYDSFFDKRASISKTTKGYDIAVISKKKPESKFSGITSTSTVVVMSKASCLVFGFSEPISKEALANWVSRLKSELVLP